MGKASRRRLEKRNARPKAKSVEVPKETEEEDPGPGFIEAIEAAQRGHKQEFDEKFGQKVEVEVKDGQMHVKLAKRPEAKS
jgi:hypothetical protein